MGNWCVLGFRILLPRLGRESAARVSVTFATWWVLRLAI